LPGSIHEIRKMNHKSFLIRCEFAAGRFSLTIAILLLLGFFRAALSQSDWKKEWERTLLLAHEEGALTIYGQARHPTSAAINAFSQAYPRIKLNFVGGTGSQQAAKIMAEKRADKHLVDIAVGGPGTMVDVYYRAGLLEPTSAAFILPEVKDPSLWWERQHHYADPEKRYVFAMTGEVSANIGAYNIQAIKPAEIQSWWDLLNSKWKGKIVATDPKSAGNIQNWRYLFYSPELGPEYIRRLLRETDIKFSADERQMMDWLGSGRYLIHLFAKSANIDKAKTQGLPVEELISQKEAGSIGTGSGHISFFKNALHTFAAKAYINWILSRDGQLTWQKITHDNSLRIDISKETVPKETVPVEGKKYMFMSSPEFGDIAPLRKLVEEVLPEGKRK
jgi:iron(III) transport system substrate-binding protein